MEQVEVWGGEILTLVKVLKSTEIPLHRGLRVDLKREKGSGFGQT